MDMELMLAQMKAEQMAERHLDFIKTNGERGRSAVEDMADFEVSAKAESNRYSLLKTEYFILRTLTQAMQEELRRVEEKENA